MRKPKAVISKTQLQVTLKDIALFWKKLEQPKKFNPFAQRDKSHWVSFPGFLTTTHLIFIGTKYIANMKPQCFNTINPVI